MVPVSRAALREGACAPEEQDPHWQCARGVRNASHADGGLPGLVPLPAALMELALQRLRGRTLFFLGDSVTLQHWVATCMLVGMSLARTALPTAIKQRESSNRRSWLKCPDMANAYVRVWDFREPMCASLPSHDLKICFAKAATFDRASQVHNLSRGLAEAFVALTGHAAEVGSERALRASDIAVVNVGLHASTKPTDWHLASSLRSQLRHFGDALRDRRRLRTAPHVIWRETSPWLGGSRHGDGSANCDDLRRAMKLRMDGGSAAHVLHCGVKCEDALRFAAELQIPVIPTYDAALVARDGHLGATTNREGRWIMDCVHYCMDTSGVLRSWVVQLLYYVAFQMPELPTARTS